MTDDQPEPCSATVETPAESALAGEIRRRRKLAEFSHAELAARIGYSRQYVSRAERPRKGLVSADLVRAIDTALQAGGALTELHAHALAERRARRAKPLASKMPTRRRLADDRAEDPDRRVPIRVESDGLLSAAEASWATSDDERVDEADPLKRSDFLRLMTAAAVGAAVPDAAAAVLTDPRWEGNASASWAARTSDAVLNPTEHARRWAERAGNSIDRRPLRLFIDQVMVKSLAADYGELDRVLSGLLGRTEFAALHPQDREQAHAALADVYAVIGWVLIKADDPLGSWIAAQRSVHAAERAQDPVRIAAATRCLAEVHMRIGNYEKATRTALLATVALDRRAAESDGRLAASVRGAALLSAAAASARHGERREAHASLNAATKCADEVGQECFDLATVFGPVNVAIHEVAYPSASLDSCR